MPRRVLILARHRLFAQGLAALCSQSPDIEVLGTIYSVAGLPQMVTDLQPDTVLVEGNLQRVCQVLDSLPWVRVLAFTLDANTMDVYEKRHVAVAKPGDLLAAIQADECL